MKRTHLNPFRSSQGRLTITYPVSRKTGKLLGPEKPFRKLPPAYSVKLVFPYVVRGIKIKITAEFRASRRLRFEDTKTENCQPKCARKVSGLSRNGPLYLPSTKNKTANSVPADTRCESDGFP